MATRKGIKKEEVYRVVCEYSGRDRIGDEVKMSDVCADSLDAVELAMGLEEKFKIQISDAEMESLMDKYISDLVKLVEAKVCALIV